MTNIAEIKAITDVYENAPVECDGMTRILHHYLKQAEIDHAVWIGMIYESETGNYFSPHFWITCQTEEGEIMIDYRSRMWLGQHVAQGVFLKKDYPTLSYEGQEIAIADETEQVIRVMLLPLSDFFATEIENMRKQIAKVFRE